MFYEIKLKVEKENSKGEKKEVIEHFITDVVLFAEAEKKGFEQIQRILRCILYHPLESRRDSQREGRRQALLQSHVDRHIHR